MPSVVHSLGGYNKAARHVLGALKFRDSKEIPRFQDAYFKWKDAEHTVAIAVVLTRLGRGERWAKEILALQERANFICDYVDDFDPSYRLFEYDVPAKTDQAQIVYFLKRHDQAGQCVYPTVKQRHDAFIEYIRNASVADMEKKDEPVAVPDAGSPVALRVQNNHRPDAARKADRHDP